MVETIVGTMMIQIDRLMMIQMILPGNLLIAVFETGLGQSHCGVVLACR